MMNEGKLCRRWLPAAAGGILLDFLTLKEIVQRSIKYLAFFIHLLFRFDEKRIQFTKKCFVWVLLLPFSSHKGRF